MVEEVRKITYAQAEEWLKTTTLQEEQRHKEIKAELKASEGRSLLFWGLNFGVVSLLAMLTVVIIISQPGFSIGGMVFPILPIWLIAGIAYFLMSIRKVGLSEAGAVLFYGTYVATVKSGPKIIWLGIFQLETESVATTQVEFPADKNRVFRSKDKDAKVPNGMAPPIRVLFMDGASGHALARALSIEPSGQLWGNVIVDYLDRWMTMIAPVSPEQAKELLAQQGERDDLSLRTLAFIKMMNDNFAQYMGEIGGKLSTEQANQNRDKIAGLLEIRLKNDALRRGFNIDRVGLTELNLSHSVNQALQEPGKASLSADATALKAVGERERLEKEGSGRAQAELHLIEARTAGLHEQANKLGISGASAINADIGKTLAENPSTKIVAGSSGMEQLIGMAALIPEMNNKAKESETTPVPVANKEAEEAGNDADDSEK